MRPDESHFWDRVSYEGECWLWTGGTNSKGQGYFRIQGVVRGVARWSYFLKYGEIPEGLQVYRICESTLCVNPLHLELGTQLGRKREKEPEDVHQPFLKDLLQQEWMAQAECRTAWKEGVAEIFWPPAPGGRPSGERADGKRLNAERKSRKTASAAFCGPCPVRAQCLAYALDHPGIDGIWGGLTRWERERFGKEPESTPTSSS